MESQPISITRDNINSQKGIYIYMKSKGYAIILLGILIAQAAPINEILYMVGAVIGIIGVLIVFKDTSDSKSKASKKQGNTDADESNG